MGLEDWIISGGLILVIVRQLRGKHLTIVGLTWPVALVVWAAFEYLGRLPGYSSDWTLTAVLAVVGLLLGLGAGQFTRVYLEDDKVMAKASALAATLWIAGMVSRLAFGLVALNGGAHAIARLSSRLDLHSQNTWPTALITMALCEVLSRTVILLVRLQKTNRTRLQDAARQQQLPSPQPAPGDSKRPSPGRKR
jgi:hypothetical protein